MHLLQKILVSCLVLILVSCNDSEVDFKRTSNEVIASHIGEPDNLNPLLTNSGYSIYALSYIFMNLQDINPENMEFIPVLAKTRPEITEVLENGKPIATNYTFELRDEAVWDNGSPVTAHDYVFTVKAILNPKVPATNTRALLDPIRAITIDSTNNKRFTVTMEGKYILNEEIVSAGFFVMPKYHYDPTGLLDNIALEELLDEEKADALAESNPKLQQFADEFTKSFFAREADGVIGCGAYRLKEWVTGQSVVLERKENWWGKTLAEKEEQFEAKVDRIIYQAAQDQNAAISLLKDEQMDVRADITPATFNDLKEDTLVTKVYNLYNPIQYSYYFWYINTKRPKLNDKKVRRALAHVVNVDQIINTVYDGVMTKIATPILPSMVGYHEGLKPISFDIEKAKSLLTEAGWQDTNGNGIVDKVINGKREELTLELLTIAGVETQQQMALLIKEDALKAGIQFEIIAKDQKASAEDQNQRTFDLATRGTSIPAPSAYDPKQAWHTESDNPSGFNRSGFGNAATDALIEEIRTTLDREKRAKLLRQLQEVIYDEQPMIFLWTAPQFIAIHKRFEADTYPTRPGYSPASFDLVLQ